METCTVRNMHPYFTVITITYIAYDVVFYYNTCNSLWCFFGI